MDKEFFELAPEIAYAICRQTFDDISNPAKWARAMKAPAARLADTVMRVASLDERDRPAILQALIEAQWEACFFKPAIHGRQPQFNWEIQTALEKRKEQQA